MAENVLRGFNRGTAGQVASTIVGVCSRNDAGPARSLRPPGRLLLPAVMANPALDVPLTFAPPAVEVTGTPGGAVILRSRHELARYARCTGEYLEHWARAAPDRRLLAER